MKKTNIVVMVLSLVFASSTMAGARKVFEEYHERLSDGMVLEDQLSYYSERKKNEVAERLSGYREQMGTPMAQINFRFSQRSQALEECKELTLQQDSTLGVKSVLLYSLNDVCADPEEGELPKKGLQTVEMVYEGGWKIESISMEMAVGG